MKYALYSGYDEDSESIPVNYGDDLEALRQEIAKTDNAWYEIVDVSVQPFARVESGSVYDLKVYYCEHRNIYRIEPDDGDGWIASGWGQSEGLYCRDCGTRLGN